MAGTCQFSFAGRSGEADWVYDGSSLVVTPVGAAPLTFAVKEFRGIAGDDYTAKALAPDADGTMELVLSRLGHDGPTLAESLRRDWLRARTDVLRLTGSGEGRLVVGQVSGLDDGAATSGGSPAPPVVSEPFRAYLFEDVMVVAREGRDLEPVFLSLIDSMSFDEAAYTVRVKEWPGREVVFSKLAKQTDEFVDRQGRARDLLSKESAATLAAAVPGLSAAGRASLAGAWMPGRLMELSGMEALCPGFDQEFRKVWLEDALRREEALYLLGRASPGNTWLGCTREGEDASGADGGQSVERREAAVPRPLWMLAGIGGSWFLEPISIEDHATYCFKGGDELPPLVSELLCAPQFSKEALYSPLEDLTGQNAELAIPAAQLRFLVELRERFAGRVIHQTVESWKKEIERLS